MIDVYEKENYREILQDLIDLGKQQTARLTLSEIARRCGLQPSYLSNVLNERCHLSSDQLYEILTLFRLDEEAILFSLDLLEWERTGSSRRRLQLKEKLKKLREHRLRADRYLEAEKVAVEQLPSLALYYLDPLTPLVHMYFGLDRAHSDLKSLGEQLRVGEERIANIIKILQAEKLIEFKNGRFRQIPRSLHLPKGSPLNKGHQMALRAMSLEHLARVDEDKHYSFMATFNADEETKMKIQVEFLKFIKKCQNLSKNSVSDKVMQLNFELFSWDL